VSISTLHRRFGKIFSASIFITLFLDDLEDKAVRSSETLLFTDKRSTVTQKAAIFGSADVHAELFKKVTHKRCHVAPRFYKFHFF
jgi:hypothetical protein